MAVSYELKGTVGVVTIDDGGKNVINHALLDELEPAWAQAEAEAGAIVLTGRAGSFCAGYDIEVMTGGDAEAARALGQRGGRFGYALYSSPKPCVAVSTGHAFTIGAVWLACTDVRIGELGRFKYSMREVALGVPFSDWPLEPLKARLAQREQIAALLHSKVYDPEGALEAGFVDELVPAGEGVAKAMAIAEELAQLPGKAYALTKRQLRADALDVMAADLGL